MVGISVIITIVVVVNAACKNFYDENKNCKKYQK